ncbi:MULTISPECIES: TIGR02450 family Trp-rich protein [Shewanella]|uniref:TIGR02450 family Trp-rich protein n=1 Tax=Shewanella polaris TaxID=2588449 RepID=A0A4Y5YIW8_9GAMM|nr:MULTISPECIES: TIGR02450 family Trp-rich protein [Shewanella]QDE32486.1 TIGR02450 family Trp-rich protein [Shewanella polaris]
MNRFHPKKLLHSKWTKIEVINKLKHFSIIKVEYDEQKNVIECIIRAEMNTQEFAVDWHDLKDSQQWKMGWQ